MRKFFLTFGYIGYIKYAPRTIGTVLALLIGWAIISNFGDEVLFAIAVLLGFVGVVEINKYEKEGGAHNDPRIIIDEVIGVFISLCMCHHSIFGFFSNIFLFRLICIYKVGVIGKIHREVQGGLGTILDDVFSGIFAGLLSSSLCYFVIKYISSDIKIFEPNLF